MTANDSDTELDLPRVHGLLRPFDTLQYIAWFAYSLFAITLLVVHAPLIEEGLFKILVVTGLLSWLAFSMASYVVAAVTPSHDDGTHNFVSEEEIDYPPEGTKSCYYCQSFVSKETKHCWDCNKCIYRFDHHCRWLNNCVGEKNYPQFAIFLSNTLLLMTIQTGMALFFFIEYFADRSQFESRLSRVYGRGSVHDSRGLVAVLFLVFLLEFLSLVLLTHLQSLHIYLFFKRLTTYQWILGKREIERANRKERRELGMPPGTPTCHSLAVHMHKRKTAEQPAQSSSKYVEEGERMSEDSEEEGNVNIDRLSDDMGIEGEMEEDRRADVAPSPRLDFSTDEDVRSRSSTPNCGATEQHR